MEQKINGQILQKRLINFAINVLKLIKSLPKTEENRIYGKQIVRSSASIGANYAEALCARTKQDFLHAMNISRKESNETHYWLQLISAVNPSFIDAFPLLLDENKQILKIFTSSIKTGRNNLNVK
ncbi:four helix bundle protein [Patescibacteria group bacterium]|nr:four helix bundle protein [Patescibacteria group bacterium]